MADLTSERIEFERLLEAYLQGLIGEGVPGSGSTTILATRLTLINYIKVKIDEIIPEGEGVQFTVETEPNISDPYNLFINAILDECAKQTLLSAPLHVIEPTDASSQTVTPDAGEKTGFIELPANFLRLIELKMTDWKRPVTKALTQQDKKYNLQSNKYLRGGIAKPVARFAWRVISATQKRVIEYFSVDTVHTIERLLYVPETVAEEVQSNLHDSLTWIGASMVLQIIGMDAASDRAMARRDSCYLNI